MDKETAALAVKSAATGFAGAAMTVGIGGIALAAAAAMLGAVASLHFEPPAEGSKVVQVALRVFALAVLATFLGMALPIIPGLGSTEGVPVAVRCGLLAIFANPISKGVAALIPAIAAFITRKVGG